MIPEKDYKMVEAMRKYGGNFVIALADLLQHADNINYAKLERAFSEYFKQYRKFGKQEL